MTDATDQPAPTPLQTMLQMVTARWVSQAISAAAALGIADVVAGEAKTPETIAPTIGAHAPSVRRLLRALASVGIFAEDESGRFGNTPLSEVLRSDVAGSIRGMAMHVGSRAAVLAWSDLATSIRTGEPAFRRVHGKSFFEHLESAPEESRAFDHAMHGVSSTEIPAALAAYDLGTVEHIVDVGGGDGTLLAAILDRHPRPRAVLYDLPHVVATARERLRGSRHRERVEIVEGSFFEAVPEGGDAYLLKHILHDWSDELALQILRNCRRAVAPRGRVVIIESVIQPGNTPDFGKLLDLEMIAITEGGRERNADEFAALLAAAGFRLSRIVPTAAPTSMIEALPV
jgi:SAM-dependent methyltransferase